MPLLHCYIATLLHRYSASCYIGECECIPISFDSPYICSSATISRLQPSLSNDLLLNLQNLPTSQTLNAQHRIFDKIPPGFRYLAGRQVFSLRTNNSRPSPPPLSSSNINYSLLSVNTKQGRLNVFKCKSPPPYDFIKNCLKQDVFYCLTLD